MGFISVYFLLFIFITLIAYFLVPIKHRWIVLLLASYVFYFINSQFLLGILVLETVFVYYCGLYLERNKKENQKNNNKIVIKIGVIALLLVLGFLKYYNFFADNINLLTGKIGYYLPNLNLLLPLGISFYSLQAIAYLVDVYRGKIEAEKNLWKFMLFMSYFPQIVQGPIARYKKLAHQLYDGHEFNEKNIVYVLNPKIRTT